MTNDGSSSPVLRKAASNVLKDTGTALFNLLPDRLRGKLLTEAYIGDLHVNGKKKSKKNFWTSLTPNERKLLREPGTLTSIYQYLNGAGRHHIPDIVSSEVGDHWYTGILRRLSKTNFGHNIVMNKLMESTLPTIGGDTGVARQFMDLGGRI